MVRSTAFDFCAYRRAAAAKSSQSRFSDAEVFAFVMAIFPCNDLSASKGLDPAMMLYHKYCVNPYETLNLSQGSVSDVYTQLRQRLTAAEYFLTGAAAVSLCSCYVLSMKLSSFPYVVVRLGCRLCKRSGSYRLARLAEKHGAETSLDALMAALTNRLPAQTRRGLQAAEA